MKAATAALFRAISEGAEFDVWQAVQDGADVNAIRPSDGSSVIQSAAQVTKAKPEIVSFLLGCGANVDLVGSHSNTALYCAIARDYREIVRILIDHGANLEARDSIKTMTALGHAAYNGRPDLFRYLVERGADLRAETQMDGDVMTPLQIAAGSGCAEIVRDCVQDCGMDIACRTQKGRTLLQLASRHPEIKTMLRSLKTELAVQEGIGEAKQNSRKQASALAPL